MQAAIYARVSSDDQAQHGFSLPDQVASCRQRAHELSVLDDNIAVFIDEGVSGSTLDRPALRQLLDLVEGGGIDYVITLDPDRLSRDLRDLLALTDLIESRSTLVFVVMEWERTPEGRLFLSLRGAVAEFERAKIRDRMLRGKRQKVKQGGIAQVPSKMLGYRYQQGRLVVESREADTVRRIFELAARDYGAYRIGQALAQEGRRPRFGLTWSSPQILRILRNPAYRGELRQLYKHPRPDAPEGFRVPVPAIIDDALWHAAQAALAERVATRRGGRSVTTPRFLLSGLIVCGVCGAPYYGVGGQQYTYYVCSRRGARQIHAAPVTVRCTNDRLAAPAVDAAVWDALLALVQEPDDAFRARATAIGAPPAPESNRPQLQATQVTLQRARTRLLQLAAEGLLGDDELADVLRDNTRRLREVERLLRADEPAPRLVTPLALTGFREAVEHAVSPADRRELARQLLHTVVVLPGRHIRLVPHDTTPLLNPQATHLTVTATRVPAATAARQL